MEKYTFKINNKNNASNNNYNASKALDDLILSNIMRNNPYLHKSNTKSTTKDKIIINLGSILKNDIDFITAAKTLANYSFNNKYKFDKGIRYKINGIPVIFYDDEVQIGFDCFSYDDLTSSSFLNTLTEDTKNVIINIYITIKL